MRELGDPTTEAVHATLEHEMQLVSEAVAMVAAGRAPRVILGGIRFGDTLLTWAARLAGDAGVRLTPLWRADEAGADLAVERMIR